jgi:hypothetical protein
LNVALIEAGGGSAFARAGWRRPAALSLRADLGTASVVLDRPDPTAPVSSLFLFGRQQDLAFEQGSAQRAAAPRRFWRNDEWASAGARSVGAANFDRAWA